MGVGDIELANAVLVDLGNMMLDKLDKAIEEKRKKWFSKE